jgi:hypothetical protein
MCVCTEQEEFLCCVVLCHGFAITQVHRYHTKQPNRTYLHSFCLCFETTHQFTHSLFQQQQNNRFQIRMSDCALGGPVV